MGSLQSRLKILETRLSPKINKPILIFDATSDTCEVFDEVLYRGVDESRDDFYKRITELYDSAPGIGLVIAIHAAEGANDDE